MINYNETCEICEGTGKIYNNGDETSGQYCECECDKVLSAIKQDYPKAVGYEILGDNVFILNAQGRELAKISVIELEAYS